MLLASVIGTVVATRKMEALTGVKLLILQTDEGKKLVAADRLGAGAGDKVLVALGSTAQYTLVGSNIPLDAAVVGIVDQEEVNIR